jgi:L-alanine-DL-glutamate epimerase-like enolase superfamily enzyme
MTDQRIVRAEAYLCDIEVTVPRFDAIQAFVKQETPVVELTTAGGLAGTGYAYTIGTGGRAVLELLRHDLLPLLAGADAAAIEAIWQRLFWATHAHSVGPTVNLALAAVDTALWDLRCRAAGRPLWLMAGGAHPGGVPIYDTEGGWLQLSVDELVRAAVEAQQRGMRGVKVKVGKPDPREDLERLRAVREAIGWKTDLMVDANQAFTYPEAKRRARLFEDLDLAWFEEPLPADDVRGHALLAASTSVPIAVGESIYSAAHFRDYLVAGAAAIVQVDAARIGGITPWLKVAHLAEAFHLKVAPHFLMELHVSLAAAVPNAMVVEHIPQLHPVTSRGIEVLDGLAVPPAEPGLGIAWDRAQLQSRRVA